MEGLEAILGTIGAAMIGAVIAYLRGRSKGRAEMTTKVRQKQAEVAIQKQKDVQDAVVDSRSDSSDWRERLRASRE